MKTERTISSGQTQSTKRAQIAMYLEINVDEAAREMLANDGITEINGVSLETTTADRTVIELQDKTNDARHLIEIRRCHRRLPVARCSCPKGREHIRCEHLVEAFLAFAMLGELGLTEKVTKKSPVLWMPFDWQKT